MLEEFEKALRICNEARCGFCRDICPSFRAYRAEGAAAVGRNAIAQAFLEKLIDPSDRLLEILSYCTQCGYCSQRCPNNNLPSELAIRLDSKLIAEVFRADLIKAGAKFSPYTQMLISIEQESNPYREPYAKRNQWLSSSQIKPVEKADTLYFVGCITSYRQQESALATAKLLSEANVPFLLLPEEKCCGLPLMLTGYRDKAKKIAQKNVENIKKSGAKRIVTACAGCYKMLKIDYPEIVGEIPFEVLHITQLLNSLAEEGSLATKVVDKVVTWHDPCDLGRNAGVYDEPRELLKRYVKELVEMELNREYAYCCGAGGGFRAARADLAIGIAKERLQMAIDAEVDALITACPTCTYNLAQAARIGLEDGSIKQSIEVYDLPVFLAEILNL